MIMKRDSVTSIGIGKPEKPSDTSRRRRPADDAGLWRAARVVASMTALLTAGCGGHRTTVTLPSEPESAPLSSPSISTTPSRQTADDTVASAYKAFLAAANRAITAPPQQARSILQDYATGDFLEFQIRQVAVHQQAHEEPWGKSIVHITQLRIDGSTATIHDCQDDSMAGLADRRTHLLIDKSRGRANQNLIATMMRGDDGKWRVTGLRLHQSVCRVP